MNKICEKPLQSAKDMLKHIARHNASLTLASVVPIAASSEQESAAIAAIPLSVLLP